MEFSKLPTIPPILTVILIFGSLTRDIGLFQLMLRIDHSRIHRTKQHNVQIGAIMYSDCETEKCR